VSGGNCKWADTSFKYDIKATATPRATVCEGSLIGVERSQQQSRVKVYCVCVAVICSAWIVEAVQLMVWGVGESAKSEVLLLSAATAYP
jgi:hypothetical protein